jgi:galactokinase
MAPPAAYSVPPAGVTRSPSLIAQCLCAQRQTSALHRQAERAQRSYVDGKARLATLDNQLAQTKSTVDSNDPAQVDAYRRLLLQSEQQNAHLYNDVLPETQSIVGRYNQAVDNYNARCSGQRFDSAVLAQVSASLVCQ